MKGDLVVVTARRPRPRRLSVLCTLCSFRITWTSSSSRTLDELVRAHTEKAHPQLALPLRGGGR